MNISLTEEWKQLTEQPEREVEPEEPRELKQWALWCYTLLMVLFVALTFIDSYSPIA